MNFFDSICTDLLVVGNKWDIRRVFYKFPFDSFPKFDDGWIIPWFSAARIYTKSGWRRLKNIQFYEITRDRRNKIPLQFPEPIISSGVDISPILVLKEDSCTTSDHRKLNAVYYFNAIDGRNYEIFNTIDIHNFGIDTYEYSKEIKSWVYKSKQDLIYSAGLSLISDVFVRRWWYPMRDSLTRTDRELLWNLSSYSRDIKYRVLSQIYENLS